MEWLLFPNASDAPMRPSRPCAISISAPATASGAANPAISDFTFGNPHEMPLEGLVSALRNRAVPENKDWFAYKTSEDDARRLRRRAPRRRSSGSPSTPTTSP